MMSAKSLKQFFRFDRRFFPPASAPFRDDPRFTDLLLRMNLEP